jgi:hypothetical protein
VPSTTGEGGSTSTTASPPIDLWIARGLTLGPVVLAFPVATAAVFAFGTDRTATADALAVCYALGLFLAFTTSFWPLPGLRSWTRFERITSCCLLFMIVSYVTHLSWELIWLIFHEAIAGARDVAWAYPWWAYIDGGDLRYSQPSSTLLGMEVLSVGNGLVGVAGLYLWLSSGRTDRRGVLLCMATAVVHLYSASLYYLSEIVDGLPNVDTASFLDTWIKFGLANAPWVAFPWLVLYWGQRIVLAPGSR